MEGGGAGLVQADRTSREQASAMDLDLISTLRGKSRLAIIIAGMGKFVEKKCWVHNRYFQRKCKELALTNQSLN